MKTNVEKFKEKATIVHKGYYDYSLISDELYTNIRGKIPIICPVHGVFYQRGDDHNRGHGCMDCSKRSCSTKSLVWLDNIMQQEQIHIKHAGNGGEYRIPNTRLFADGYCEETNTIYEFDGDAYHGNPNRYLPNENCHPNNKNITAEELYDKTITKHQRLLDLGYNLITIWESDFDNLNLQPINQYENLVVSRVHADYPQKLLEMRLEIVGEYLGSKKHHDMRCLDCGGIHNATPVAKIWIKKRYPDARGCPTCNKNRTNEKNKARGNYVNRLLELNYKVTDYKNAGVKCLMECTICGKQKFVTPSAIIQHGVPCCTGE